MDENDPAKNDPAKNDPVKNKMSEAKSSVSPPEESRSWLRRRRPLEIIFAVITVVLAALYTVSWIRTDPVEPAAFFAPRAGENRLLVFAHQGGEAVRPSNTMIAFTDAVAAGADVLDTDMHMTKDGVLVLIHDETVDRTSNGNGAVRDLTLAQLRELDFGYHFTPPESTATDTDRYPYRGQGHGIVTVDEMFAEFPDIRIGIEIKQTTTVAAVELCRLIRSVGHQDQVLVSSFAQENLDVFRSACPEVATSATEGEVRRFYLLQRVGLVGLVSPSYEALQVPEEGGGVRLLTEGFAFNAAARGIPIVPWTINDTADFERLELLDPAGINTDYPERLVQHLR